MSHIEHFPMLPYPKLMDSFESVQFYLQSLYRALTEFLGTSALDDSKQKSLTELDDLAYTSLADPGADRIVFWDDSDTQFEFLVANNFLSISANNLNVDALDEDDMASNSAVHLSTQQSIKAYVDNSLAAQYAFKTITGITNDVVADSVADTLTLSSANAMLTIVGTTASDTITFTIVQAQIDHGSIGGLTDDDHTQYIKHALSTAASDFLVGSGVNTFIKKTLAETGAILEGDINHDNLQGFVGAEHINHSSVSITAGTGLTGGGDISSTRTLSLSHLGIQSLADPNADKILFWDDGESACKWLGCGNSIAITTVTLDTIQDIRTSATPTFAGLELGDKMPTTDSRARAYLASDMLNLTNGAWTQVTLAGENYDTGNDFNTGTHQYTVPVTGYYFVLGQARFSTVVDQTLYRVAIYVDGANAINSMNRASGTNPFISSVADVLYLTATQVVDLYVQQNSGGNLVDVDSGSANTFLAIHLLSV